VIPLDPGVELPLEDFGVNFGDFGESIIIMERSLSEHALLVGRRSDDVSFRELLDPVVDSGKLKNEPILVVLSMLRLPQVDDDKSPARGDGKCCTISSKSNLNESLVSVDPGLALCGGIKFINFDNVGVSAVILKFPSKLTCLSKDKGDSNGPWTLPSLPLKPNDFLEGVSAGGPMSTH